MNQYFIILSSSLKENFKETKKLVSQHYQSLSENVNKSPIYLDTTYNSEFKKQLKKDKEKNSIFKELVYINTYHFFLQDCERICRAKPILNKQNNTMISNTKNYNRFVYIYDKETKLMDCVNFYDDKGFCYRTDKYNEQGFLSMSTIFTVDNLKKQYVNYYRQDGSLAISLYYSDKSGEHKLSHIVVFDKSGSPCESFISEYELNLYLIRYYLNRLSYQDKITLMMDKKDDWLSEIEETYSKSQIEYSYF